MTKRRDPARSQRGSNLQANRAAADEAKWAPVRERVEREFPSVLWGEREWRAALTDGDRGQALYEHLLDEMAFVAGVQRYAGDYRPH